MSAVPEAMLALLADIEEAAVQGFARPDQTILLVHVIRRQMALQEQNEEIIRVLRALVSNLQNRMNERRGGA